MPILPPSIFAAAITGSAFKKDHILFLAATSNSSFFLSGFLILQDFRSSGYRFPAHFTANFKQISQLSFHRLANGDKSWYSRLFRHLSYREKLRITLRPSAQLSVQK